MMRWAINGENVARYLRQMGPVTDPVTNEIRAVWCELVFTPEDMEPGTWERLLEMTGEPAPAEH
jgi:hypothetical protein